jgi:hypothetical protein
MNSLRLGSAAAVAIITFALSATGKRSALAEAARPPAVVELVACEQPLEADVRRIVGVELRATVVDAVGAGDAVTRVVATCRGLVVDLVLTDAATAKRLERTVALSEVAPTARARLLALAVAELVVASRQEIPSDAAPTATTLPPRQPLPSRPRADDREVEMRPETFAMADAIGVARAFPGSGLWLLGAGARGCFTLSRPLRLSLEVTAEWGKPSRTTGQVAAFAIGGAVGLGWGIERKHAFLMPWLGARGGGARLTGEPNPDATHTVGETQTGPWLGPEIGFAATLFPRAPVHAMMALSAGVVLVGVRGEVSGDRGVNFYGPWAALVVGVGLAKP